MVTGASGFIGSVLTRRLLNSGHSVHVLLRKQATLWRLKEILKELAVHTIDIEDYSALRRTMRKVKPHILYHLAAYGAYPQQSDIDSALHNNVLGTWHMLKASRDIDYELFVNTGSSSEYGSKHRPMAETELLEPNSIYAVTKATQTHLCAFVARRYAKPIVTLRPFSVYGPYEEPTRLVPQIMRHIDRHTVMPLANPATARDYVYVNDMVDVYCNTAPLKRFPGYCFNVGSGIQTSLKKIVVLAQQATGRHLLHSWNRMPGRSWDTAHWVADTSRTTELLNWRAKTTLIDGLRHTWHWYQIHADLYEDA